MKLLLGLPLLLSTLLFLHVRTALAFVQPLLSLSSPPHASRATRLFSSSSSDENPFDAYELGQSTLASKDTIVGNGDKIAQEGDVLTVGYVGKLHPSGKEFAKQEKFAFEIGGGNSMPGFERGLVGVREGTTRLLRVPPSLAYGANGVGRDIPGNADLEYEVAIQEVARGAVETKIAMFGKDRIAATLVVLLLFAVTPFLPQ